MKFVHSVTAWIIEVIRCTRVIGRAVGKYRIVEPLGEGGMGVVYRARHELLDSPAAIKVLLPQFSRDPVLLERFFKEAKAASSIRHVGITAVFEYGRLADDQAFIIMELLRGEDLKSFLARHGPLVPPVAIEIATQLLSTLAAAHETGVVHRDLKPDNIYLTRDHGAPGGIRVKVLDFGIAKLMSDADTGGTTRTGSILGTPTYMAPEQCKGGEAVDGRADLYAVGCVLFELLTGRPPFDARGSGEILAMHIYQTAPRIAEVGPTVPAELESVVARLLAKRPDDRAPSAAWTIAALERVPVAPIDGLLPLIESERAPPPDPRTTVKSDDGRLARWIPVAVIAIAVAIAALAVILIGGSGEDITPTPAPRAATPGR